MEAKLKQSQSTPWGSVAKTLPAGDLRFSQEKTMDDRYATLSHSTQVHLWYPDVIMFEKDAEAA